MLSLWIFYLPLHELFISCALSCWCLFARRAQHQPKHAAAARARSITWQFGARAICWCRDMTRNLLPSLRSPPAPLILHWAPALLLLSLSLVRFHPSGRGGIYARESEKLQSARLSGGHGHSSRVCILGWMRPNVKFSWPCVILQHHCLDSLLFTEMAIKPFCYIFNKIYGDSAFWIWCLSTKIL